MRRQSVFILSDVRSGSTVLDLLLGAHPDVVSLGEIQWLRAYLYEDRRLYDPVHPLVCACGTAVSACRFWLSVERHLGRPLDTLELRPRSFARTRDTSVRLATRLRSLRRRALDGSPGLFRNRAVQALYDGPRMARDSSDLFDAVCASTGRGLCVNSSKSTFLFRAAYDADPARTRVIVLVRDFRAVVHSKMKRGESLEHAASGWRRKMTQIDALTRDVPAVHRHLLKYESLCSRPEIELRRLGEFLGIEFTSASLPPSAGDVHHIGGSPSKFDPSRARLSFDDAHVGAFGAAELRRLRACVGPEAERWGYDAV